MFTEYQAIQNLKETKARVPGDEDEEVKLKYKGIHEAIRSLPEEKRKELAEKWGGADQPRIQVAPKKEEISKTDQLPSILEDIGKLGEQDL